MSRIEIKPGVYYVGVRDWDRRLFDELIPLPDGTSYNAYIVKGKEKTCLIDTVDPPKIKELIENLNMLGINSLDYIIANHAEQDHSGGIPEILKRYPDALVVTNAKCKSLLMDLLLIPEDKFLEVEDGQSLSLGDKTLQFIFAPWVHWPETMLTYLKEDNILFPCDFFGSHLATSELYADKSPKVYESAKRYYAEIMMPFRNSIKKHLEKLRQFDIKMIAPSHGPIHNEPEFILNAYTDWTSDTVKNEVVLPYVSMHGSVEKLVHFFTEALIRREIKVLPFNLTRTDIGALAISLVDAATIVLGTPTVLTGPHPSVVYAAYLANALRPKTKFASIIGSYGWGGRAKEMLLSMLGNLKLELIEPVIIKGYPRKEHLKQLDRLADEILKRHRNIGII
ncbi:MBL fold hydrolase [candidate division WOR-3 bacterium 4484_100]|uniref:MBL fold hydrolase n=1 Tax=candidate division WOR-3 bacterium 4484_100 TaxID=1936077 RepID=A0A1V4QHF2_UNCW3|nr:MAG: MBL fold hydrolase [candidate division WOR-3 bacterium 4484_100]